MHFVTFMLVAFQYIYITRDNQRRGIAITAFYYIQQYLLPQLSLDMVLFCRADNIVQIDDYQHVMRLHHSTGHRHALVIGDVRDRALEFPPLVRQTNDSNYMYWNYENIHLFVGSDCFGISTELLPGILQQARNPDRVLPYLENDMGHDIVTLAQLIPTVMIHWIPVVKSHRFWKPMNTSSFD